MPNPNGTNSFDRFASEPVHGTVRRAEELRRSAPMSGAPLAASAQNAPSRAQRRAVRGDLGASGGAGAPAVAPEPPPMPDPGLQPDEEMADLERVAAAWAEVAARPGASQLVRQIAAQAAQEAGLGG